MADTLYLCAGGILRAVVDTLTLYFSRESMGCIPSSLSCVSGCKYPPILTGNLVEADIVDRYCIP